MKTVGAFEAKTHFSDLLREVERGETFEIHRRHKPVARLVGLGPVDHRQATDRIIARVRELRATLACSREDIHGWIGEGRA